MKIDQQLLAEYESLTDGCGWVDASDRARVEISGKDRVALLNGFCTADIKRLQPGGGYEAFITNAKGKTIGHVFVFSREDRFILDSASGQAAPLIAHLDRYVIREDVKFHDATDETVRLLIAGKSAPDVLNRVFESELPDSYLAHTAIDAAGTTIVVHRVDILGSPTYLLAAEKNSAESIVGELNAVGAKPCSADAMEIARIEAGFPLFGVDISDDNLPQEVDRNDRAISFTKGCYLGQETVARLDALGHVNRVLTGVRFASDEMPAPGTELKSGNQTVGRVTSAAWSPACSAPLAMAYIRNGFQSPGNQLESPLGPVEIVELPVRI